MCDFHNLFTKFDEKIRLSYDDNQKLIEKREMLLGEIRSNINEYTQNKITFEFFNQGSYDLGTGIHPLPEEDHDIDVGIVFNVNRDEYKATKLKELVYKSLDRYPRKVEFKRPCIRVQYTKDGENYYHIDLAVYCKEKGFRKDNLYLAKGFLGSSNENIKWEEADPYKLKEIFKNKFNNSNDDLQQFKRIIRYLKRWKDVNFQKDGNERPTGISLTACVNKWFRIGTEYNYIKYKTVYNDFTALKNVVENMYYNFYETRCTTLPVTPNNNLFEKMSDKQIDNFKNKLKILLDALNSNNGFTIGKLFGDDF